MREPVTISGSFVRADGSPVTGRVSFKPSILWVYEDKQAWPCLAPDVLLVNGEFSVQVTPTSCGVIPFTYEVTTPAGIWKLKVERDGLLKDLLPAKKET
jgi:hypothetical protein